MDEKNGSGNFMDFNIRVVIHNFVNAAKHFIWIVVLLSLIVGGFTYFYANKNYVPWYRTQAIFSVHASYSATTDILSYNNFMDKSATMTLSATFPYVIESEHANMLLQRELDRPTSAIISATATADAALFTMTVTSRDPQDAYDTLFAAITVYPQAASSILGDTQLDVINYPAAPPTVPINANDALNSAISYAVAVFIIGLVGIFILSLTRKTVHSAEDLRKLVNLKCLSYVPSVTLKKHSNAVNQHVLITNPRISSSFNESIRNLRIKIQKLMAQTDAQVLLVTSTLPNEGKTTVATNLALSLASEGKQVILIDGDLRKQALKGTLGVDASSDGLVEILSGNSKNFRLLNVPKSNLLLLSGDETVDQPQPLLDTPRFQHVLELLRKKLDYIIIDSPPAGILSDAATTAKYADATLYIVRQDLANSAQILDSIQNLAVNNVNLIGCVLNHTLSGTTRYGYGAKYGAGYGYTYGYKYSSSYYSYGYGNRRYGRYADAKTAAKFLTKEITDTADKPNNIQRTDDTGKAFDFSISDS